MAAMLYLAGTQCWGLGSGVGKNAVVGASVTWAGVSSQGLATRHPVRHMYIGPFSSLLCAALPVSAVASGRVSVVIGQSHIPLCRMQYTRRTSPAPFAKACAKICGVKHTAGAATGEKKWNKGRCRRKVKTKQLPKKWLHGRCRRKSDSLTFFVEGEWRTPAPSSLIVGTKSPPRTPPVPPPRTPPPPVPPPLLPAPCIHRSGNVWYHFA